MSGVTSKSFPLFVIDIKLVTSSDTEYVIDNSLSGSTGFKETIKLSSSKNVWVGISAIEGISLIWYTLKIIVASSDHLSSASVSSSSILCELKILYLKLSWATDSEYGKSWFGTYSKFHSANWLPPSESNASPIIPWDGCKVIS